jgi:hypothetical protein
MESLNSNGNSGLLPSLEDGVSSRNNSSMK